ncbi:uncharacterized protein LOC105185183 isoform X2 [Harpegnathos saltator]|uniref:uncharacterized protein LOC105185183 isoform X2 n=1 Tax=Harpegnathos saltator TaxID=610380 RepID=UPI00058F839F|nr:uncharacterized protein LOC105185183 isoform X2 [Harpegnathos saltator]
MSVIESLLNLPLHQASDNICRFCRKTFCCTKCRDRHVNKVHSDLSANCFLCASKTLPMRQFEFEELLWENKRLLSHITDQHLPLHCVLCENLFETGEDLKSIGTCKWYSEHQQLLINERLLRTPAPTSFEAKLKRTVKNIKHNSHAFFTPPEIYRNTSTPMFLGQKNGFEYQTPCAPNFSLKTPKTNSPITQSNTTSKIQKSHDSDSDIKFFSFSPNGIENERTTPFRNNADEQYPRSNSGRKLDIERLIEAVYDEAEEVALYDDYITFPVDMDLTNVENNIPQEHTPKLNTVDSHEESGRASDMVKKVRFSDQYDTLPEFGSQVGFNVKNMTEEDEDVFHDAHDASGIKDAKSTKDTQDTGNTKDVNDTIDSKNTKDIQRYTKEDTKEKNVKVTDTKEKKKKNENVEDTKDAKGDQVDDRENCLANLSIDSSGNTQVNISQENKQNAKKENRAVEALSNGVSVITQKGTSRVLMMVLVENNSGSLNSDLMPLISSGLKKLEEQIVSSSSDTSEFPSVTNTTGYTRKSTTKVEMSISSVESYSNINNNAEANGQQVVPTFPSSSVETSSRSGNGGILSAVTQAVKLAFKNLSGSKVLKWFNNDELSRMLCPYQMQTPRVISIIISSFVMANGLATLMKHLRGWIRSLFR